MFLDGLEMLGEVLMSTMSLGPVHCGFVSIRWQLQKKAEDPPSTNERSSVESMPVQHGAPNPKTIQFQDFAPFSWHSCTKTTFDAVFCPMLLRLRHASHPVCALEPKDLHGVADLEFLVFIPAERRSPRPNRDGRVCLENSGEVDWFRWGSWVEEHLGRSFGEVVDMRISQTFCL